MKVTSLDYTNYQPKQRHYSIFQPSSSSSTLSNPSKDTSCVIRQLTTKYLPTFVGWICLETVASVARKPSSQLLLYASLFRYMSVVYVVRGGAVQLLWSQAINVCNSCLVPLLQSWVGQVQQWNCEKFANSKLVLQTAGGMELQIYCWGRHFIEAIEHNK